MLEDLMDADTAEMTVLGRDGQPHVGSDGNPWRITFAGPSHPIAFQLDEERQRRLITRAMPGGKPAEQDPVELAVTPLVRRCITWSPIELEGKPLECTPENARLVFSQSVHLRNQAERFLVRASNFTRRQSVN